MRAKSGDLYRKLPPVGRLLESAGFIELQRSYSRDLVVQHVRIVLDELRAELEADLHTDSSLEAKLNELEHDIERRLREIVRGSLRLVINATGVVLQTNLGRAPLSEKAITRVAEISRGYCNLEVDLQTGERGHRDAHVEQLILDVLALRSAPVHEGFRDKSVAVVNNCGAACFLALNSLAEGGEVIVSRGELVEIGGGFRIPDILRKAGAVLREVGTTNRTRISDYEAAITSETRLILRVHRSNFSIEGFTEQPALEELRALGQRTSLPVFEDQGTGCVIDLAEVGIRGEFSWMRSVTSGIDLVACSGDKLLGGPQCGILVGAREHIRRIKSNPLFRAMRVDKLAYAALEATFLEYLRGTEENLPAIAMIHASVESIEERCHSVADALRAGGVQVDVVQTHSLVGGGTTPQASLPSFALRLRHDTLSDAKLAALLRNQEVPVMARAYEGHVLLDLRTVRPEQDAMLSDVIKVAIPAIGASRELQNKL